MTGRKEFVPDSLSEGDGFELLVPPQRNSRFGRAIGYRAAPPPRRGCGSRVGKNSNPASSSRDSASHTDRAAAGGGPQLFVRVSAGWLAPGSKIFNLGLEALFCA
jgi:hypothetical protein